MAATPPLPSLAGKMSASRQAPEVGRDALRVQSALALRDVGTTRRGAEDPGTPVLADSREPIADTSSPCQRLAELAEGLTGHGFTCNLVPLDQDASPENLKLHIQPLDAPHDPARARDIVLRDPGNGWYFAYHGSTNRTIAPVQDVARAVRAIVQVYGRGA